MKTEEVKAALDDWRKKRDKLPCPAIKGHCKPQECGWGMPDVYAPAPAPGQQPDWQIAWVCKLDVLLDRLTPDRQPMAQGPRSSLEGISLPPGVFLKNKPPMPPIRPN